MMYFNEPLIKQVLTSGKYISSIFKQSNTELKIIEITNEELLKKQFEIGFDGVMTDAFISKYDVGVVITLISSGILLSKASFMGIEDQDRMGVHPSFNPSVKLKKALERNVKATELPEKMPNCVISGATAFFNSRLIERNNHRQEWKVHVNRANRQVKINKKVLQS